MLKRARSADPDQRKLKSLWGASDRAARGAVFSVPDVVRIWDQSEALRGVDIYIGDGASIARPILRTRAKTVIGHVSIRTQIEWCREERIRRAIFSHCGSEIVKGEQKAVAGGLTANAYCAMSGGFHFFSWMAAASARISFGPTLVSSV